jgi:hypothetical protein
MNWIEKKERKVEEKKVEEKSKNIKELIKNIEKNSFLLSKYLYESTKGLMNEEKEKIYKEYISKSQFDNLIKYYIFIKEYNLENIVDLEFETISYSKILFLEKNQKNVNNKEKMLEYIKLAKEINLQELKVLFFSGKKEKVTTKQFVFNEDDLELFEATKNIYKSIYPDLELTNQNILKALMVDFLQNNLENLE